MSKNLSIKNPIESSEKIGFLIPSTSKNRDWKTLKETHFYTIFIKSLIETSLKDHNYIIYLGYDNDDPIYTNTDFNDIKQILPNNILLKTFIFNDIPKGHVTKMWNYLFKIAYDDECTYFYQCGDDISIKNKGWENACISHLRLYNDIGVCGPVDLNHKKLLTQSFVSRKHMEIFNFYFPEEIKNWYCDNWIQDIYKPDNSYILQDYQIKNSGGPARYDIIRSNEEYLKSMEKYKDNIDIYYNKNNS